VSLRRRATGRDVAYSQSFRPKSARAGWIFERSAQLDRRYRSFLRMGLDGSGTCVSTVAELDPENVLARIGYSQYLAAVGRSDDSLIEARRAVEIDPLAATASGWLGMALVFARRYGEGISAANRALELNASFVPSH